jgi:DNA polymerase-2
MTFRGWLLDLYLNQEEGLTLWFIGEDDRRVCFRQAFPVSFYAAGPNEQLRALWKRVRGAWAFWDSAASKSRMCLWQIRWM